MRIVKQKPEVGSLKERFLIYREIERRGVAMGDTRRWRNVGGGGGELFTTTRVVEASVAVVVRSQ